MKQVRDVFGPTVVEYPTPFGTVYLVGFLNLFGASLDYFRALQRLDIASESQVHNTLNEALHD